MITFSIKSRYKKQSWQFVLIKTWLMFLTISSVVGQGTTDSITFQHIKYGMSQSSASVLYEDNHGFVWIGTPNGLNKFDGTDFKIFEKSTLGQTGLTEGFVNTIYEDGDTLLIGTNQGLSVYDRTLDIVYPYSFKNQGKTLAFKNFQSITKSERFLWLGTYSNGLYRYNIKTGEIKQFLIDEVLSLGNHNSNRILEVKPIGQGQLIAVSSAAIFVLNEELEILHESNQPEDITTVAKIDTHNYLLGTKDGALIELKIAVSGELHLTKTMISPGFIILSIAKDQNGSIWMGTENNGLFIYTKATKKIIHLKSNSTSPLSISSNSIWSLMSAKNGVMWLGPFKNGLSFYDSEYTKFTHIKTNPFDSNTINNNVVNCFQEDEDGNIWIGTDGGGLNYWNRSSGTFKHYALEDKNFSSNVVLSLLKRDKDQLWVGTWANGLSIFNTKTKTYETWNTSNSFLASNNITALFEDKKKRIWIVSLFGEVQVYYPETQKHKNVVLRSEVDGARISTVARIMEDKEGNIWAGSQTSGIFKLIENDDQWTSIQYHDKSLKRTISNNFINTINLDSTGTIWIGTQGGLNRYISERDSFEVFTKSDGLKNDFIKAIVADNSNQLWLSTSGGLIRFDPNTKEGINYDIDDGLQGNEFNASASYLTTKGELIFGGSQGFNIFRPDAVTKRKNVPKVFISGLKIFNQPVFPNDDFGVLKRSISQEDSLTFKYDQAVINFDFRALTYRHPDKVNYAYFLEGFETEWNYVGKVANATYTNLNPGLYTFHVKSSNSDGVWNDRRSQLVINILPPFWQTWWFRLLVALLLIGCTYLIYFLRVRSIKAYQVKLEEKINERTKELQYQKKKLVAASQELSVKNDEIQRFTFAVSHDLKSPLNSIEMMAGLISLDIDHKKQTDASECLGYITQACSIMKSLIADITEIAKLGKIENKNEILDSKEIIQIACNMAIGRFKAKKAQLIIGDQLPKIYGDRNRLIQVFENLIDNAVKYMGDQKAPLVEIKSITSDDFFNFIISDNGSGMDVKSLEKLFTPFQRFDANTEGTGLGLYMIKKIIESHKGTIHAKSEGKGMGTTFVITLPNELAA